MVECLIRDQQVAGHWKHCVVSLGKTLYPLVHARKSPCMIEKLFDYDISINTIIFTVCI